MLTLFLLVFASCHEPIKSVSFSEIQEENEIPDTSSLCDLDLIITNQKASTKTMINIRKICPDKDLAISARTRGMFYFIMDTEMSLIVQTNLFNLAQDIYINLRGYNGVIRELKRLKRIKLESETIGGINDSDLKELFLEATTEVYCLFLPYQNRYQEHVTSLENQKLQYRENYFLSIKTLEEYLEKFNTPVRQSSGAHLPSNTDLLDDY